MTPNARLRGLTSLAGRRGLRWAALDLGATLALAACEYAVAAVLVVLLLGLRLVGPERVPAWLGAGAASVGPVAGGAALLVVALLRGLLQLTSRQAGHMMLETVRERLVTLEAHRITPSRGGWPVPVSQALLRIGDHFPKAADAFYHLVQALFETVFGALLVAGMLALAWRETVLGLAALTVAGALAAAFDRSLRRAAQQIVDERAAIQHRVARACRNWLLIRALGLGSRERTALQDEARRYARASARGFFWRNLIVVVPHSLGLIAVGAIALAGVALFATPPATLVAFVYLFGNVARNAVNLADHLGATRLGLPYLEDSLKLVVSSEPEALATPLSAPVDSGSPSAAQTLAGPVLADAPGSRPPAIRVADLDFAWPDGAQVLQGLSLDVPPGTLTGVVGPNGSGKTTLLALILGVLRPASGLLTLDGLEPGEWLHRNGPVGFVGEDANLVRGTVLENLAYGRPSPLSADEAWRALELVGLRRRVEALPGGLDFVVEETEQGLSAGERQALAVARALASPPALLVLDEASAHLDAGAERTVTRALRALAGRSTVLIASHRRGILAAADRIISLDDADRRPAAPDASDT